jgi:hypothetical protein
MSAENGNGSAAPSMKGGERWLRWLIPVLVAAEIGLIWTGAVGGAAAIGLAAGIESLVAVVGLRHFLVARAVYVRERERGQDGWNAFERGVAMVAPRMAARLLVTEIRLWVCLATWLAWRYRRGPEDFAYHRRSIVKYFLVVVLFTLPVEVLAFELLIPWGWLRWVLVVLAAYAVVWMAGLAASLAVLPHSLGRGAAVFRYGLLVEARVPYAAIESVELERAAIPGAAEGLRIEAGEDTAYIGAASNTQLVLRLSERLAVRGFLGPATPVGTLRVTADDPEGLWRALADRVATELEKGESQGG